jgi:hypothetical protein
LLFVVFLLSTWFSTIASAQLIISEFRVRGPNGANDEFIEIENNSGADHTVTASSGSGYGIAASDGVTRCSIPNGTIIPSRGHYLCVNSVGYSLASYPAGNGTTATGDATYVLDIPENTGIALFNNNTGGGSYSLANRMDAVGSTSEGNALYKEGTGYPAISPFSIDYSFQRDNCGKGGSITTFGPCPSGGLSVDTNNNAADFVFVDTNGTSAGAGQRLGSPGPQNLSAPIYESSTITHAALDPCVADNVAPNTGYNGLSDPPGDATFGTLTFRRTYTNNTGSAITRLRMRVIDITTFPAPSGIADLRTHTAATGLVTVDRAPCGSGTSNISVEGTTFEEPPSQPNGGAFNGSYSAGSVTLGTPLANGASIDLAFLAGIQQHGQYKFRVIAEALPEGGSTVYEVEGCTDGCTGQLEVVAVQPIDPNPTTSGTSVDYRVTFNEPGVTGVDAADFTLATTGAVAGATITGVAAEPGQNGINWIVTINTGTGAGTIRLDDVDNNTIVSGADPLGGAGAGNGDFNAGDAYLINDPPDVLSVTRANANPTAGPLVNFTVTFSEAVTGVDLTDFALTTTGTIAGATITNVSGSGATRTVTVNVGTGTGTIRLDVVDDDTIVDDDLEPLGGPGAGNGAFTAGEVYTVVAAVDSIPTLDPRALLVLALVLAAVALLVMKR